MSDFEKYENKVYCRRCNNDTHHQILFHHMIDEFIEEASFYWSETYMVCQCMGCDTVTFVKQYDDSKMHFFDPEEQEEVHLESIEVYPPKPLSNKYEGYPIRTYQHLPPLLATLYKQVVSNVEQKHYLLAAAGLRMIIEGICNDLSVKKGFVTSDETGEKLNDENGNPVRSGNLNGRINGLIEKGVLTEKSAGILHIIRKLGNQTVHKLDNPSRAVIIASLEIIEHTFINIYELKKYDSLREKYFKKSQ